MVDRITEVNGAAAETQNNFGLFKLCHKKLQPLEFSILKEADN